MSASKVDRAAQLAALPVIPNEDPFVVANGGFYRRWFNLVDDLQPMLEAIDQAYVGFDNDRTMLERSLDLSSQELLQANSELRILVSAFPDHILRLNASA